MSVKYNQKEVARMFILDMVHHNPGEKRFDSRFNSPAELRQMGYNGKVYSLFESPVLAVDWNRLYPGLMTGDAEQWRLELYSRIKEQFHDCQQNGLKIYAMSDLLLFPRTLVSRFAMEKRFGNINEPWVQEQLRNLIDLVFSQFPELDGLVVRIGETYLHDAPYHIGKIEQKHSATTIIPLLQLLREELCVKRGKTLIFRTWGSFDENLTEYTIIAEAIQPHPLLIIAVKHCEDDFHRGNPFSKIIGFGPHQQLIEIQCSREYEGKGAYPNYLAHGIVDGFEEHQTSRSLKSIGEFAYTCPDKFAGIWTWTRGGGWEGPYISNELWPDVNAWILARWCADVSVSEDILFKEYCRIRLGWTDDTKIAAFRQLCLLSEMAIVRGKASLLGYFSPWWTRDQYIGIPQEVPYDTPAFLTEKHQATQQWEKMYEISQQFGGYIETSTCYGLCIYRIYESIWNVRMGYNLPKWHQQYEAAWNTLTQLAQNHPDCATLYQRTVTKRLISADAADKMMMEQKHLLNEK